MSDKSGYSEERTDWLGNKYTQHYDKDGNKAGYSDERTDWLGNKYTQHHDKEGSKAGYSDERTDWLGNEYTQHHDKEGSKAGYSDERTDWLGNKYTQHYDTNPRNYSGGSHESPLPAAPIREPVEDASNPTPNSYSYNSGGFNEATSSVSRVSASTVVRDHRGIKRDHRRDHRSRS
jgi:hypothetical protein